MKILILTACYPPLGHSGHDDRCRQVVRALSKRGHRIQVLTSNHRLPPMGVAGEQGVYRRLTRYNAAAEEHGLGRSYRTTHRWELANAAVLAERLERLQPDVVYVWNLEGLSKSLLLGLQAQGVKLCYDLHQNWLTAATFESDPWFRWWRRNRSRRSRLYRWSLRGLGLARSILRELPLGQPQALDVSHASVCSVSLRDTLIAGGVRHAAALPVLPPALDPSGLQVKQQFQPVRKFIWAGRLVQEKGPALALAAAARLKARGVALQLDFYGIAEPSERKAFRAQIELADLSDCVQMHGIRPGELLSIYAQYDAFLFTGCCNDPTHAYAKSFLVSVLLSSVKCIVPSLR